MHFFVLLRFILFVYSYLCNVELSTCFLLFWGGGGGGGDSSDPKDKFSFYAFITNDKVLLYLF